MRYLAIASFLVLVGCKGDKANQAAPQTGSAPAAGSAEPGSAAAAPANACDVVGDYRVRFASNGAEGWWWRFKVTDPSQAELVAPVPVLGIEKPGPLALKVEAPCTLVITASHGGIGDMTATLQLDNASGKVTGELVRAKPRYDSEKAPHPMAGVREAPSAPAAPTGACITPGTYKLSFDPKAKYKPDTKREKCDINMFHDPIAIHFEWMGGELFADAIDESGVQKWAGTVQVKSTSTCDVDIEYADSDSGRTAKAKLTFAGDKITGIASEAEYQIIEDGEAGENMWSCTGKNVAITGAKS